MPTGIPREEKPAKTKLSPLALFGTAKEQLYFIENLSMLAASGMPIRSAIDSIEADLKTRGMRHVVQNVRDDVEEGFPLWRALSYTGLFRDHIISLVRVGEESGRLSENLKLVAETLEKDRLFKSKIRSALMYPVFVLGLTLFIGVGIAWFILPRLAEVFASLKLKLPLITKILIASGVFLAHYGNIAIPAFLATIALVIYFLFYFRRTRFIGQSMLFHMPGVHTLIQQVEISRFSYLLGTLLGAGIPITHALDSVARSTTFPQYYALYIYLRGSIGDGDSFHKSFLAYSKTKNLIPSPIQQLIVSGEQSGNLSTTLLRISLSYEAKLEQTMKDMSVILEPILLVIVWLGVVGVALAVILPIYSLVGGLGTQMQ
ncbi:MAG TPA: type II secretion system F family protein [Candidatus Paceibacterota bacterium]|nr:type II secretion system F family protein [Candidatus Paceibacterota bacterium]